MGKMSACWTLYYTLKSILKAFSPIIPYITDYLYRSLFNETINLQTFEKPLEIAFNLTPEITNSIKNFNASIWKIKQEKNLSLKDPIELEFKNYPSELGQFKDDLEQMHNIHFKK